MCEGKKEIVKGLNQTETKQRDSKWTEVTWLECPLHINVISIINNLGEKHIQLSVHWSLLAWETANSHGVVSCEYHLTVVLPCVGLLVLSVQKWWSRLLSSVKCVEAPLHCVCFSAGLRALISGAAIWQSQQVMTEAVVRSHPEPQRRLTFQADEGLIQYTEHKGTDRWSLMMPLFMKIALFSCHSKGYFFRFSRGSLEC